MEKVIEFVEITLYMKYLSCYQNTNLTLEIPGGIKVHAYINLNERNHICFVIAIMVITEQSNRGDF